MDLEVMIDFDSIYLQDIRRNSAPKGSGAEIIKMICRYADENQHDIFLDAENGSEELIEYYAQFGFRLDQNVVEAMDEEGEDYAGPWTMWRIPHLIV